MKKAMRKTTLALVCAMALIGGWTGLARADAKTDANSATTLANLGFEKGLEGWTDKEALAMSRATPEAARSGKQGLRIEDNDPKLGSALLSPQIAITPNASYGLSFWAKTGVKNGAGVWVRYYDPNRKTIDIPLTVVSALENASGEWTQYKTTVMPPDNAAFLAFWVHTYSAAQGSFDFDDFRVEAAGQPVKASEPGELPAPVARKSPAYIVIKVDDLVAQNGGVHPMWNRFVAWTAERNIKSSIGIIANSLENASPAYLQWIKDQHATGRVEFWNHGYDHKEWDEGGKKVQEFKGVPYEQQKQHLQRSNALAREKLGFAFRAFGAPFNATDENTAKALAEENDIQTWLYGDAKNPGGKLVLERVGDVNIEYPTFVPDAHKFAMGYNRHPERDLFVIQGHPAQWTEERFAQFAQIVDFLTKAGAVFVTPSEYARLKQVSEIR
jgi:peptidoglycan/xylan/chitin deacetylase (PgdA/CDA1 family)